MKANKDFGTLYDSFIRKVLRKKFLIESTENQSGYVYVVKASDIVHANNQLVENVIEILKKKLKKKKKKKR